MEFSGQYLTYNEYKALGGTLDPQQAKTWKGFKNLDPVSDEGLLRSQLRTRGSLSSQH